ncbi:MAG: PepSY-associated TM helix domain-containing protein [Methylocystis sp.]
MHAAIRAEFGRRLFLRIHRWIGLFLGAIIVLVGLSGSILSYRQDIDEFLNASMMRVDVPVNPVYRPLNEIFAAAKEVIPPGAPVERLRMPRHPGAAAVVTYATDGEDLDTYFWEVFVDPYSAKVKGQRVYLHGDDQLSQPFIRILVAFHWTLLLGFTNAYILGSIGIAVFFSVLIGLYLWRPLNGNWRQGLEIKWGATPARVAFDIHRTVGAYYAAIFLVMLATGVGMIFKPATRSAVTLFSQVRPDPVFGKSTPIPGKASIDIEEAVAAANSVFPDGKLHWILLPSGPDAVYVVGKRDFGEPNKTITFRNVGVDQYSGQIRHVQDRNSYTAGEKFMEWQFPLHSGEAFGELGRPFILLIGLGPLILYVSGFLRWRHKARARRA